MRCRSKDLLALGLLAGALTACENATGPAERGTFDAGAALEDYQALDAILGTAGWKGFLAMGGAVSGNGFDLALEVSTAGAQALRAYRAGGDARALAAIMAGAAGTLDAGSSPVISPFHRGRTFVYDGALGRYVVDPDRTGAPASGVRFIVYAANGTGGPDPAQEIGYADLIDEGDGSAEDIALRLVVVAGADTVLDYRTTLDETGGVGRVTVGGFIRAGGDQLDFSIEAAGSGAAAGPTLDVTFRMAVEARSFEIQGLVRGATQGESETGDIDITVRHGRDSFRIDLAGTKNTIEGTVYLNDEAFVVVSGKPQSPSFSRPGGGALTHVEALLLYRIVDIVEDVFDLFEDLLDPVDELVILAVIL